MVLDQRRMSHCKVPMDGSAMQTRDSHGWCMRFHGLGDVKEKSYGQGEASRDLLLPMTRGLEAHREVMTHT